MSELSEDDDLLAAEFALGLIPEPDRGAVRERLRMEPAFAAAVGRWEAHLIALAPDSGMRDLWPDIAAKIASDAARPAMPDASIRERLRRWKAAAAILGFAASLLLVLQLRGSEPAQIRLAAILTGPDRAVVTIGIDAARDRLVVQSSALSGSLTGRVPELWIVPSDGRPRSLGVITPDTSFVVRARETARDLLAPNASLAISIEPAGGSPTGQPTGPIILTGKIVGL